MPDTRGFLLPDEKRTLLRRYAPILVLFPEDPKRAPYPDEGDAIYTVRGSYHPRAVEMFLELARLKYKWPAIWREPRLLFFPRSYTAEQTAVDATISESELDTAVEQYQADPRYAGLAGADLRQAVRLRLVQEKLTARIRGLDLPIHRSKNLKHWKAYFRYFERLPASTTRAAVYGRIVQGLAVPHASAAVAMSGREVALASFGPVDVSRTRMALQYWFQYLYDDWANRHEGDLESITLLVDVDEALLRASRSLPEAELLAGVTVLEAGYSSHEDGYRRLWSDVQQSEDGRPLVYVARGSSASYFEWRREGYPASARVGFVEKALTIPGMFIGARRFLGRRWDAQYFARFTARGPKNTDWVAVDSSPEDRLQTHDPNPLERLVPVECRGTRRTPGFTDQAGLDANSYYLETDDLFWLEMAQEYGLQWGQDSLFPGTQGPRGLKKSERDKKAKRIDQFIRLEDRIEQSLNDIEQALQGLSERRLAVTNAIPELDLALRPLRPANLADANAFPKPIRNYVYAMWGWILKMHPEAWPGGPGLLNWWRFSRQLRPGIFSLLIWRGQMQPLLDRQDPLYHIKTLLARVRQTRYETQHAGAKWDNPFSWVRYTCMADSFHYGRQHSETFAPTDFRLIDCEDVTVSMK